MAGKGGFRENAGKPKGSKNKVNQITEDLRARLNMKFPGYHPVVSLATIAHDESQPIDVRLNAHKEVAKYYAPQLKAVETKDTSDNERVYRVIYEDGGNNPAEKATPQSD